MLGKSMWKLLELPLSIKQMLLPGRFAEIGAIIKDLKDPQHGESYHSFIQLTYLACTEESWILQNNNGLS